MEINLWEMAESPWFYFALTYVLIVTMIMMKCFKHMDTMAKIPQDVKDRFPGYIRQDTDRWSKCKFFIGGLIFMPTRLVMVIAIILVYYLCIKILLIGASRTEPYGRVRSVMLRFFSALAGRSLIFFAGIIWVTYKDYRLTDSKTKKKEFAPVLLCNHLSIVDILVLMATDGPSFVSKEEIYHVPVVGPSAAAMQSLFVKRGDAESRGSALEQILERKQQIMDAQGKGFPQLAIFPEGTTSCGTHILDFKKGGIIGNFPVQPMTLKYSSPWVDFGYAIMNEGYHAVLFCSQPYATLEVSYLEMHECNEEDWAKDAAAIQRKMADHLGCGISNLSYRDQQELTRLVFPKSKAQAKA